MIVKIRNSLKELNIRMCPTEDHIADWKTKSYNPYQRIEQKV